MDGKKKRNRKKKGNQGKNAGDVTSNAGEIAAECHDHESDPKDHHNGVDTDDAVSNVGDGVPQYQNHVPDQQADHSSTSADNTMSSAGEGILFYQNHETAMTQEDHKVIADQTSVEISDSAAELEMHRLYNAKLDKLHETIKQLEDEKSSWLQKVTIMENELEELHNKVGYHAHNEVLLEEKLNNIQNGHDVMIKKEEVLDNKVRRIEAINDALTHEETSLKERISGLEETNRALLAQVKVLAEASNNTVEENQRLVKGLDELESRLQAFESKAALAESSMIKQGNAVIVDRSLSSSETIASVNNYSQLNNIPSNGHANNHLEETSVQIPETAIDNIAAQGLTDVNTHQGSKKRLDEPTMSEEIVPVPLDDIQIHENDPQPSGSDRETDDLPFSDAPIVGAPFRLISFVARYVSGADLVSQK